MNYPTNANQIEIFVITRREGLLTKVGHDLLLSVKPRTFSVDGDTFDGSISPADIEIHGAWVGERVEKMSKGDLSKIGKMMLKDVFKVKKHSEIQFSGKFSDPLEVKLMLVGKHGKLKLEHDGKDWVGILDHRQYGIRQVKALLGTLKVTPTVELRIEISE